MYHMISESTAAMLSRPTACGLLETCTDLRASVLTWAAVTTMVAGCRRCENSSVIKARLHTTTTTLILHGGGLVGWLDFNVPFQHKYGYIRDDGGDLTATVGPHQFNVFVIPINKNTSDTQVSKVTTTSDHTTTVLRPFFRDHPGEPVPKENFWTFLCCKGRLTEADTPTIRLGDTPSGLSSAHLHHPPFFTSRMPFLPPNQQCQSTEGN